MNGMVQGDCEMLLRLGVCVVNGSLELAHAHLSEALQDGCQPLGRESVPRGVSSGGGGGKVIVAAERWEFPGLVM